MLLCFSMLAMEKTQKDDTVAERLPQGCLLTAVDIHTVCASVVAVSWHSIPVPYPLLTSRLISLPWCTYWIILSTGNNKILMWFNIQLDIPILSTETSASLTNLKCQIDTCHNFRFLSLFGWRSAVDVTGLLAIADPPFIFHLFHLVFPHTWFTTALKR